jgi:hypothetical protein
MCAHEGDPPELQNENCKVQSANWPIGLLLEDVRASLVFAEQAVAGEGRNFLKFPLFSCARKRARAGCDYRIRQFARERDIRAEL